MRHGKKYNHLGRKSAHRKALLKNLTIALVKHKRISTTLAKAKALRTYVEPLVTKSKTNTTHSRRVVFGYLQNKEAVNELFGDISAKVATRPGGYLRVIKTGWRKGDGAEMAMIEFVDYNTIYTGGKTASKEGTSKKKRTRRGSKTKTADGANTAAKTTAKAATTAAVVKEAASGEADDLKKIEGIGPKIEELLNADGINTFAALAGTSADKVKEILAAAGARYAAHDPTTWPKQAEMASKGEWEALEKWQDELDGGKVVDSAASEEE